MKHLFIVLIIPFYINTFAQSVIDTIITILNDTISCQVTHVSKYSIFYKYQKRQKLKDKIIPRINVGKLIVHNKNIKIPIENKDSGINEYYRKSKLDNKYEVLLLKDKQNKSLKLLADSTISTEKSDIIYIATKIQSFAKLYKCKLIHISDIENINPNRINVKLYDSSDEFYIETLKEYQNNMIYFLIQNMKNTHLRLTKKR